MSVFERRKREMMDNRNSLSLAIRLSALALVVEFLLAPTSVRSADDYKLGPDSFVQPGVPQGLITKHKWISNEIFPGTVRDYWIYVPKQYTPSKPACLLVVQDGGVHVKYDGDRRVPIVLDNLIHKGDIPVTIGVLIDPGVIPPLVPGGRARNNRNFEYDSLGDRYSRFLMEAILPEVEKKYELVQDPRGRAIMGSSSGATCAWTVAWERPDAFSKVISWDGSFANVRGANLYPSLIRKTERKPIRVFMQAGANSLNNVHGNWALCNQQMASALEFSGYDYWFVLGDGGHTPKHAGSLFPETLRWIWRDYTSPNE